MSEQFLNLIGKLQTKGETDAPNTRVHNQSLSAIDTEYTDTSIKSGGVKQDNTRFRCDKPNI